MRGWTMWVLAILVGLGAWSCQPGGVSQQDAPTIVLGQEFTAEELGEDLDFLWTTLADVHPDLLHNVSSQWWMQEKTNIEENLPTRGSRLDFFRLVAPTVTALGDGHTGVRLPNEEWAAYVHGEGPLLPLHLVFSGDEVQLVRSLLPEFVAYEGQRITAINGVSTPDLQQRMLAFVPGERIEFRENILNQRFLQLLWLATDEAGPYVIELEGMDEALVVPSVSYSDWAQWQAAEQAEGESPAWYSYSMLPEAQAAVLDFRAFSDREMFASFLKEMFSTLQKKGIEHLFIDIRQNGGGNSQLGDDLLAYLTDQPYWQFSQVDIKVSPQIKAQYPHWPALRLRRSGTIMQMKGDVRTPGDNPLRFDGNVYLLTSSYSFSSATSFAAAFKDAEVGLILGDETGGLLRTFGDVYSFWLPNTGLQVGVSHKRFVSPGNDPEGVRPDVYVSWESRDQESFQQELLNWLDQQAQ